MKYSTHTYSALVDELSKLADASWAPTALGAAAGMGLSGLRQGGQIVSGEQKRIDPFRLASAGLLGAGAGATAGYFKPRINNLLEETAGAARSVREAADYVKSKPFLNLGEEAASHGVPPTGPATPPAKSGGGWWKEWFGNPHAP